MATKNAKYYGTGRRKSSVARVYVTPGTGKITINKHDIDEYLGLETLKLIVRQPFAVTGTEGKFDVTCTVKGGGTTGQAGAIRHGISRALLTVDEEYRPALKAAGLLTRDPRMKERKKYGQEIIFRDSKRIYKPQKLSVSGVFLLSIIVFSCGETQKFLYRKQRVNSR